MGPGGMARATAKKMIKGCAAPAPIPFNLSFDANGDSDITIRGLNIRPDTTLVLVPGQNDSLSEFTNNGKTVVPSATDVLGTIVTAITLTDGTNGEVFAMYLIGPCLTRVFVGLITFSFP